MNVQSVPCHGVTRPAFTKDAGLTYLEAEGSMKTVLYSLGLILFTAVPLAAQDAPDEAEIRVTRAVVATQVEDREPVGEAESFPATVGTLYFYTILEGEPAETTVEHVWLRNGEETARVPLNVQGPRWRTWSTKQVPEDWTGEWTAQVVADDEVIESVSFTVGGSE